jgi:opacity protein-like surface antigen
LLTFVTATALLLLACPAAFAQNVPRNFDEEYALYNETVRDIIETGKNNQKCFTEEVRNGLIRRIDKAISLIKQFALSEGIKLTAQSLTKFVNPQLSLFAKRPSRFTGKEDLQGWTNFMVGRLTYLRGKILDTKICRPPPAPPPPPTEVKPQCEQPLPTTAQGLKTELEGIKNWGLLHTTERNADTDEITNEFTDNGDPLGGGIVLGYNFRPWHDSIVVGPFGSFDWLDQTVNHTFPGGSFLGTRSNWIATVGGKAGVATTSGVFFYGLAGRPG